jgi:hypothetical protein
MKLICLTNMYISPIQHGIQSAHAMADMFVKYQHRVNSEAYSVLYDWAKNHKTMIVLNAGPSSEMMKAVELCHNAESVKTFNAHSGPTLPWCEFHEPDADNLLSAVVYVEPDYHKIIKDSLKENPYFKAGHPVTELVKFSISKPLAR